MMKTEQPNAGMTIEQFAGKQTARLAQLVFKLTDALEKKDKELSQNGYNLQHPFRQGFMCAQSIVSNIIDGNPPIEQPAPPQSESGEVMTLEDGVKYYCKKFGYKINGFAGIAYEAGYNHAVSRAEQAEQRVKELEEALYYVQNECLCGPASRQSEKVKRILVKTEKALNK